MNSPSQFEVDVRNLLRLQGWTVSAEQILGHKKVDAYAEKLDEFGSKMRIAIECKHWSASLTQHEVTEIYVNYYPLVEKSLIDLLLIVTLNGISPSAETYVSNTRLLRHLTYGKLLSTIINFDSHLQVVCGTYQNDKSSSNYIAQLYREGEGSLEQSLLSWINTEDTQPLAILGGYGMGKTTLVRRIAYLLAQRCMHDASARIPVVLPLSSIATDQTLEGLLGRQFTALSVCPNYNFQLFLTLNTKGRFVIFFDGFDEMKKTISWDSLMFNLEQIHQLVVPGSKVVLLGRPSAFLTDEEHDEALHGRRKQLGRDRPIPGWPDYRELHINEFTRQQVAAYIQRYLTNIHSGSDSSADRHHRISKYLENMESAQGKRLLDLAARPVQLSMLMELLPEYTRPLDKLTVALLYSEFIDMLLRREHSKAARHSFRPDQRKRFASRLAYWMWQDEQRHSIDLNNIPDVLFDEFFDDSPVGHIDDVKRDLLSGGFLDRRAPNIYYFPHRSFQEYLVAEELVFIMQTSMKLLDQCAYITPEVASFFVEIAGKSWISKLRQACSVQGRPSLQLLDLINTGCAYYGLSLLEVFDKAGPPQKSRKTTAGDREALLRKLAVSGVVTISKPKKSASPIEQFYLQRSRNLHRKGGVTPKGKFRA